MTAFARVEDAAAWAVRRTLDGVDVRDEDLERLEIAYSDRRLQPRGSRPGSSRWVHLAALAAVVALALAASALVVARGARSEAQAGTAGRAASSVSRGAVPGLQLGDLEGLWRVEAEEAWPPLWVIGSDGSFEVLGPADLARDRVVRGTVTLTGPATMQVTDQGGCTETFGVEQLAVDRLDLDWLTLDDGCAGPLGPERAWTFSVLTRVGSAPTTFASKYVAGTPELARWGSAVEGTWVLRGSGRILSVVGSAGPGHRDLRYLVTDDVVALSATGGRRVAEHGTVRVGGEGRVVFLPDGRACPRTYRVWADYAALDARLDVDSCGRLGDAADTWIRLL